jgi:opacity protein-like surface antigen
MTTKRILAAAFALGLLAAVPLRAADGVPPKFQIRLYGGLSYLEGGDANDGVGGIFRSYSEGASLYGYSASGAFKPAHLGMGFGGDFIFQITPNFGIGVGVGYMQASKTSTMTFISGTTLQFDGKPSFSAVPLRLGLFFTYPMGPSLNFNFNVGGGYYMAKMTSMLRISSEAYYEQLDNEAKANGFGFQGGMGVDFRIASNVFLFIEAQGQMANFGGFEGTGALSFSGGSSVNETGKLYYFEETFETPILYPIIKVASTPPSGSWVHNLREAKVNFNGGQIVVGILLKI